MTFVYPWVLLLLPVPIAWAALSFQGAGRRFSLVLKTLCFVAVIVALAQPVLTLPDNKIGAVVLVDTSASITRSDLDHASSLLKQMEAHKSNNWMNVVPFASQTRTLSPSEASGGMRLIPANDQVSGTNFETALTGSMSAIPAGYLPRLVLISDGNENEGSSTRAVAELQQLHVPVDTIPLAGLPNTSLRLESLSMPREAYAGEQIPIDLTVDAPQSARATVELSAEGKSLGHNPVDLRAGANVFRVHAHVNSTGATSIAGRIAAGSLGELPFEQAIDLKRAKILYLSEDPAGSETNLLGALKQGGFEVTRDQSALDKDLRQFQLVLLNNPDLTSFTPPDKQRLSDYVKSGGGLLLISGERQIYKEDQQMDVLDNVLPAKLAPPKTPEGTTVALIIDKSSSMEGKKIELARASAIGVVDHLRPVDTIGVLIFDNSFQWAVPMRSAQDKTTIDRLISGIMPDGGTQIAPALAEAYRKVSTSKAVYKHIVLMTDGISEEGDSMSLSKDAQAHQVTISTVGLGQDVNRAYLEKIAQTAGGRSYFLNEPQGLEQILLKDVQDFTGSTAVEKPLSPIVDHTSEILRDVGMESAPALKGYTRFIAKPESETILKIDEDQKDPLYVRWQYGLGRAAVFASDAKSRWADAWMSWAGFDKFWINAARDLLPHANQSEASAQFDSANNDLLVTYRLSSDVPEPASVPQIFVVGPAGFAKPIDVRKTVSRVYQGRLHIGALQGLFRIRPLADSPVFPEVGLYRERRELQDRGSNPALLTQISHLTGGRFNPAPESIFDSDGRSTYKKLQLWPLFLCLAIAVNLMELIARKWYGLAKALHLNALFQRG